MTLCNVIATPGLGNKRNPLNQTETFYGQAQISINANVVNGNLFVKDFAHTFVEQGFQSDIGYQYNSQSKTPWRLNQGKIIGAIQGQPNEINSFVIVEESDGHQATYTYDPNRSCYVNESEAGGSSILTYTRDGRWKGWNPSTNFEESYNINNHIESITDSSGNYLTYNYDDSGRLNGISSNSGNKIAIEYSAFTTEIYAYQDHKNTLVMRHVFDEANRLKNTVIPINADENYEINYAYSASSGLLESITQSDQVSVNQILRSQRGLLHFKL